MKKRIISTKPRVFKFSPRGRRGRPDNVILKMEEFEAMRLADSEGISHRDAAKMMNISRQTFERVLKSARGTVADGVVNGKSIKIWGGTYDFAEQA
jgi:uncharacterized protein